MKKSRIVQPHTQTSVFTHHDLALIEQAKAKVYVDVDALWTFPRRVLSRHDALAVVGFCIVHTDPVLIDPIDSLPLEQYGLGLELCWQIGNYHGLHSPISFYYSSFKEALHNAYASAVSHFAIPERWDSCACQQQKDLAPEVLNHILVMADLNGLVLRNGVFVPGEPEETQAHA